MASIQKRISAGGTTRWRAQVRLDGHPPVYQTFDRKTDAQQWAAAKEADIRRGKLFPERVHLKRTVGELVDRYKLEVLPQKPRSERTQKQQIDWWKSEIGSKKLVEVTPALIVETRNKLLNPPKTARKSTMNQVENGRSPATANRYLAVLRHAFNVARKEWNWIDRNAVADVSLLKEPKGRTRFLNENELEAFLAACRESDCQYLYPIVMLALSSGKRKSNIVGLRWSQVDLDRRCVFIPYTKNSEPAKIHLRGEALELIKEMEKTRDKEKDWVFPSTTGRGPFEIKKHFDAALRKAKIEDFRFHDLRHTAASYLAMSGATTHEIAEALDHKTLQMVQRYAHLTDDHRASAIERMNEKFLSKANEES